MTKRTEYRRWSNGQLVEEYIVIDEAPLDMSDWVIDDEKTLELNGDDETNELYVDFENRKVMINGEEINCEQGEREVIHAVGFEAEGGEPFYLEDD
jgi:hypothetical protein